MSILIYEYAPLYMLICTYMQIYQAAVGDDVGVVAGRRARTLDP